MNPLQLIHYWVSVGALVLALASLVALIVGLCFPLKSKRGDRLVAVGVGVLLADVAVYLVYAATAITTVVVMRS